MKALTFVFWLAVMLGGFEYAFHSLFSISLFSPFILLIALFTVAASRSSAE
jgi:hypothetical protein